MGPQGSGKGTQGEKLAENFNIPFISTGDIYRRNVKLGTDIGKLAENVITKGELMSDEITRTIMQEELTEITDGVIIDGYPRNIKQAQDLDNMLQVDYFILLEVPNEITIKRISNRRSCKNGHIFNLISRKPKQEGVCDDDGEKLFIRDDDKSEYIKRRLEIYDKEDRKSVV